VCRRAGVTARHFYAAFGRRENLLLAAYEEIVDDHMAHVRAALDAARPEHRLRAGLGAALEGWAADERRARIAMIEIVGVSPELEARRHAVVEAYGALVAAELAAVTGRPRDFTWQGRALVGATVHAFEAWLRLGDRPPLDQLIGELAVLYAASLALGD
jgi:AcrR family transcriptional regulator